MEILNTFTKVQKQFPQNSSNFIVSSNFFPIMEWKSVETVTLKPKNIFHGSRMELKQEIIHLLYLEPKLGGCIIISFYNFFFILISFSQN